MTEKKQGVTHELYLEDSELFRFCATVLSCKELVAGEFAVELDQTAFFPEGGGQYADIGVLGDVTVRDVRRRDGHVYHITDRPLTPGTEVEGQIDAQLRMARMQNHTGEHILSGLVFEQYGYRNVGFHLGNGEMTLDFDRELDEDQLADLELQANRVVWANLPVRAEYPSPEELAVLDYRSKLEINENVRIVTVEGVDCCACCAPHVKSTGEIGLIKIVQFARYKGGVRLWVLCGAWALEDYGRKHESIMAISHKYSVKPHLALDAVLRMDETLLQTRSALGELTRRCMNYRMQSICPDEQGNIILFEKDGDADALRYLANLGADRCPCGICAVFSPSDGGHRYVLVSRQTPLRPLLGGFKERFGGGGGGTDGMIQGNVKATQEQLEAFFQTLKS